MTVILYGIKTCDTMKKARVWLETAGHAYTFHDYKVAGVDSVRLQNWVAALGWEVVLNRAGTTFRALPASDKAQIDAQKAVALMVAQPSMIKRPIVEGDGIVLAGFKPEVWAGMFGR